MQVILSSFLIAMIMMGLSAKLEKPGTPRSAKLRFVMSPGLTTRSFALRRLGELPFSILTKHQLVPDAGRDDSEYGNIVKMTEETESVGKESND